MGSPSSAVPPSGLDADVLEALAADLGDVADEVLADLMATYLDEGASQLRDLGTAVARGDADGTHRVAHSFKSSSAALGAVRLAALLQRLEDSTGAADPQPAYLAVRAEFEVVVAAVVARGEVARG